MHRGTPSPRFRVSPGKQRSPGALGRRDGSVPVTWGPWPGTLDGPRVPMPGPGAGTGVPRPEPGNEVALVPALVAWLHLILPGSASVDPLHALDVRRRWVGGLGQSHQKVQIGTLTRLAVMLGTSRRPCPAHSSQSA